MNAFLHFHHPFRSEQMSNITHHKLANASGRVVLIEIPLQIHIKSLTDFWIIANGISSECVMVYQHLIQ